MGFPVSSAYVSSKFALEGLSESISYELEQFGIKVILIEPGITKTNFGNNFKLGKRVARNYVRHSSPNSPYTEMTQNRIAGFKPRFESGSPALEVADIILKSIMTNNPNLRYLVGTDALKIMDIREKIPNKDFRKLVMDSVIYHRKKK
jgi:NAD(P)-dependent dehydrogenase (short-subunit alcohol dehydrogenase family)